MSATQPAYILIPMSVSKPLIPNPQRLEGSLSAFQHQGVREAAVVCHGPGPHRKEAEEAGSLRLGLWVT